MPDNIFLRLKNDDGSWIEQPGLMLLAATTSPRIEEIEDTYASMVAMPPRLDPTGAFQPLSRPQALIHDKIIIRRLERRIIAGTIPLRIAKLHKETGNIPSINEAIRQQVEAMLARQPARDDGYLEDTVRNCFKELRPIAHFLATLSTHSDLFEKVETQVSALDQLFSIILGWQNYLDDIFAERSISWRPIRCQELVKPQQPFVFIDDFEPKS